MARFIAAKPFSHTDTQIQEAQLPAQLPWESQNHCATQKQRANWVRQCDWGPFNSAIHSLSFVVLDGWIGREERENTPDKWLKFWKLSKFLIRWHGSCWKYGHRLTEWIFRFEWKNFGENKYADGGDREVGWWIEVTEAATKIERDRVYTRPSTNDMKRISVDLDKANEGRRHSDWHCTPTHTNIHKHTPTHTNTHKHTHTHSHNSYYSIIQR